MPFKTKKTLQRIVSLMLVLVMAFGMMPTSVLGDASGGAGGSVVPLPGGGGNLTWNTDKSFGSFTRFTVVEVNAPDDSTTYKPPEHEPNGSLNPHNQQEDFRYDTGMAVNSENYKVLGSIMIGSTNNDIKNPAATAWYDTNALDYRLTCEQNSTSAQGRLDAVYNYAAEHYQTSLGQPDYYSWDQWKGKWGSSFDFSDRHLDAFALESGGDIFDDLWVDYGSYDVGGDNTTYGSFSNFSYSLIAELAPDVWNTTYYNSLMGRDLTIFFQFDDGKTYRIIAEPGFIVKVSGQESYVAVTARDLAAIGIKNETIIRNMATPFMNCLTGLQDDYPQPYGFYAEPNGQGGYDLVTVDSINGALWSSGASLPDGWKAKRNFVFGVNSSGTGFLPNPTVDGREGSPYYSVGMAVLMPLKFDIPVVGLTISKTVTNTGEEYQNMEWQFQIELQGDAGSAPGPFKVTIGENEPQEFATYTDLVAFLQNPVTLKSGERCVIEGLPEGTTYTVTELVDGAEAGGSDEGADVEALADDTGDEDATWKTFVTDSGAANPEKVEATETTGTIPENGIATVSFENTLPGGPAHLIVDYNLPGATATYDQEIGTIVSEDTVECGKWNVGDTVPITSAFNGQILEPNVSAIQIGTDSAGEPINAVFLGLFTSASESGKMLTYKGGGEFEYTLGHEDLTVIYARWQIGAGEAPIPPSSDSGDGSIYTVFFDSNFDGGPSFSALAGKYSYDGSIQVGPYSGTYHFEIPITWSYPDPPQREGWGFAGWSLDPQATEGSVNPEDPGHSDTYYGVWVANETYWEANGGEFADGSTQQYYPVWVYRRGEFVPVLEEQPKREGYTFNGWFLDANCTQPLESYEEGVQPGRTYYAGWTAEKVVVTYYDTRDGTSVVHTQDYLYDDELFIFGPMEDTVGWTFTDWNTSHGGGGMTGKEANGKYLNTTDFNGLLQYHPSENNDDDPDSTMSAEGYWTLDFYAQWEEKTATYNVNIVWNDYENNDGARPTEIELGLVDSYNNNTIIERIPVTGDSRAETWNTVIDLQHITDNDSSLQKRQYKIVFLSYVDIRGERHQIQAPAIDGQEGTMELAAPSTADAAYGVNTLYSYGVNNYAPDYTGTGEYDTVITYNHSLITTGNDIQMTITWDDDSDNDGVRPDSVMLVLYANGVPVSEFPMHNAYTGEVLVSPAMCEVTDDGDTWTYTFVDYQRYSDGQAIDYTVAVKNLDKTTTFNANGYTVTYPDTGGDSEIGDHNGATISRPIERNDVNWKIVWDDENNRDGQRPDHVSLQLLAYQWNEDTYRWEYVEVGQAFDVQSDDVNTMTASEWTGTYVLDPKLPVFHDGLRILYHIQVTSDLNAFIPEGSFEYGWVESEYGNQNTQDEVAAGKPGATPTVTISQNTNTVSVQAQVYWNDSQNNDSIRPRNIILQLYSHAPGEEPVAVPGAAYRVTISGDMTADNWYYTFSGMPKYAEGQSGVELIYTIQVFEVDGEPLYGYYIIDANGEEQEVLRYEASYLTEATENDDNIVGDGTGTAGDEGTVETDDFTESDRAYVKLTHIAETQTMNFSVNWHDEDNRDNMRPESVLVDLYKTVGNHSPIYVQTLDITAGEYDTWTYRVTGLAGYEDGQPVVYSIEVSDEFKQQLASLGYTVSTQDNIVHLYYTPGKGSITTQIYWSDEDDNDGYRPDSVIAELYANGVATGQTADLNATNNWTWTWTDLDVHYVEGTQAGTDIIYSVQVQTPEHYTVTYNPTSTTIELNQTLYVQLYHGGDVQPVPVTVYWNDNSDYDQRRPESLTVQLLADGEDTNETLVLTAENADATGNVWTGVFENMPVYSGDGKEIYYSLRVYDPTTTTGGYQVMTAGTTLYLSREPILSNMYVSFQFKDGNNADGNRPTGLYLQLTANGVPVDDSEYLHTVSFDANVDGYRWNFGELPVYAGDGTKIAYNVVVQFDEHFGATDYNVWTSQDIRLSENESGSATTNQIIVRLTRDVSRTSRTGHIFWFDCNDLFGQRPDSLNVILSNNYSDTRVTYTLNAETGLVTNRDTGAEVGTVEVSEWTGDSSCWTYTITGLAENYVNSAGESAPIYYWIDVNPTNVAEYYTGIKTGQDMGMDASLTHAHYAEYAAQSSQNYTVNVQWLDNSNAWGYRPDSNGVQVDLLANGTVYDTIYLTQADLMEGNANMWTHTWVSIPTFRDGEAIVWSIRAADAESYTQYQTVYTAQATTIAYRQSVGFNFTVNWDDSDDDDAVRPDNLVLNVYADGEQAGSVTMTGEGNTWTGSISDMTVWRESDADAAVQYTFRWDDVTEQYLNDTGYTATSTLNGEEVASPWFYYLSASQFGDNTDPGYDVLTGTYEWETTLSYDKEVADYYFSVTFDDDVDRDGFRPDSLNVQLLADGQVIDTRTVEINKTDSVYPLVWEDQEVWESGERIVYTIQLEEVPDEYTAAYNDTNTAVTLTHVPYRVSVTGQIIWDDSTELKDVLNPDGEYVRSYEQITRVPVYLQLLADGEPVGEPVRIGAGAYGEGENLNPMAETTWDNLYKYRNNGVEIVYTMTVFSDELTGILNDGHNIAYDFEEVYVPKATITHDLYDIRGTVYYLYDYSEDFLLADVPVTAYLQQPDGSLTSMGSTRTDEHGNFEFLNLPQGLYTLRATYHYGDMELAGTNGADLDRQDSNGNVIIVDRDSVNDGDYYKYTATGHAYYQTDTHDDDTIYPVPDGSVALLYRLVDDSSEPVFIGIDTIEDGEYVFTGLQPSDYLVNVVFNYKDGNYTYDATDARNDGLTFVIQGADASWPDIIKQVNDEVTPIDPEEPVDPEEPEPELPVPCVVHGYVYYSDNGVHTTDPVEGVDVYVYTEESNILLGKATTDESGYWEVEGIGAGTYVAVFTYEGSESRVLVFTITDEIYEAGTYEAAPQYFDRNVTTPGGRIEGVVLDEEGYPMRSLVAIYDEDDNLVDFAYTNSIGAYQFTVTAGFDYNVRILSVYDEVQTFKAGDPDDEFTELSAYTLSGKFYIDGQPQANQLVMVYKSDGHGGFSIVRAGLTDSRGDFAIDVYESGNYMIVPYINEAEYAKYYVSVGYEEERPQVNTGTNGEYVISGVEDFDSIKVYRIENNGIEHLEYESDTPGSSYEIPNMQTGMYRLELTNDGVTTYYSLTCPAETLVAVDYTVKISGYVRDEHGNPIIGAQVDVLNSNGDKVGPTKIILSDGYYGFDNLPEGEYTVQITTPHTSDVMADKWTIEPDSYGTSYPNGMEPNGVWVWNINANVVSGQVTDQKGRPVEGVNIVFSEMGSEYDNYATRTDENGEFTIGLANGEYSIRPQYYWNGDRNYEVTGPTYLEVTGDTADLNFTVNRYDLTVKAVRAMDDMPAVGAQVTVRFEDGTLYYEGETDENGELTFIALPDRYIIDASYNGIRANVSTGDVVADRTIELRLNSMLYITGQVTNQDGEPVSDGIVYYDNHNGNSGYVYTDSDGRYEIEVLAGEAGEYDIYAEADVYTSETHTVTVDSDETVDIMIDMTGSEDTQYTITGVVTDEEGNRLANALVTMTWGNDKTNKRTTSTNDLGEYQFTVSDGTYYLEAVYEANGYRYTSNAEYAVHVDGADEVQDLLVLRGYTVVVTVKDMDGYTVPDAEVIWSGADKGTAVTDGNGEAILYLPLGDYRFYARTENRSSDTISVTVDGTTHVELTLMNAGILYEEPDVYPEELTIWGYVYTPDGEPYAGAEVYLYKQDFETLEWYVVEFCVTTDDGYYEFQHLDDGVYKVESVYDYTFQAPVLGADHTISGYVQDEEGNPLSNARVELWTVGGDHVDTIITGEDGYYEFEVDQFNEYHITIYDAAGDLFDDFDASMEAGSNVISGIIQNVAGDPVANATINVVDETGEFVTSFVTDETGAYSFTVEEGQTYYLEGTYPLEYEIDTSDYDRDTTDRNAPYLDESWYTIEGYVHDMDNNPVEGATVILTDQTDEIEFDRYITAADGYYIFDGLEDGIYHVHVIYRDKVEHIYEVDTGTGDITDISPEEPDPVEENINVTITNFSRGTVTEPEDGWYEGENSFQLVSNAALRVFLVEDDGSFTELAAVDLGGDIYEFTAYLEDGDEIVVVTLGDADLDGVVRAIDATRIAQSMIGLYDMDEYQMLAADADRDGRIRAIDATRVAQSMIGLYDLVWNLR